MASSLARMGHLTPRMSHLTNVTVPPPSLYFRVSRRTGATPWPTEQGVRPTTAYRMRREKKIFRNASRNGWETLAR